MKVLLIDPPGWQRGINVGLAYLSSSLEKEGHRTKVVDINNAPLSKNQLKQKIIEFKPGAIGYSVKTATYSSAVELSKFTKEEFPDIIHIAGGPHITLYYEEFLADNRHFDLVIIGDGETSLSNVCSSIEKGIDYKKMKGIAYVENGKTYTNEIDHIKNLDELPFPSFQNFNSNLLEKCNYPLVTSRGCPYSCIYCTVGLVSGKKWRSRSPDDIIKELKTAKEKHGIIEFEILDDTFTQNVGRAIEFCELLIEEKLNLRWSCPNGIRADRINEELAQKMKESGCHTVIFGIESGNQEVFNNITKGETLGDIENAVDIFKNIHVRVGGYFIIGLPKDNLPRTLESLKFGERIGLDWSHFNLLVPYPLTQVREWIKDNGRFIADYKDGGHFANAIEPIFETNDYPAKELVKAYKIVHTRQRLFHLLLDNNTSEWKLKMQALSLILRYDTRYLIEVLKTRFRT